LDLKQTAKIKLREKEKGIPAGTVAQRWRPWPAARNLTGVLESGSRDHYRVREKRRKREKLKANSPETKTRPRMNRGRRTARDGGNGGPVDNGDAQ
jgi:hypothetical protein